VKDAAYCFPCRHFGVGCENAWTKEGYKNWKKGPKEHVETKKHIDADSAWVTYRCSKAKGETVLSLVSTAHAEAQRITREWIKFVTRVLRYCASQEIALRAHRDAAENKGNFIETVNLVLQHSSEMRELRSKLPDNAHYLGHESQNTLLHCMATMVQNGIVQKVRKVRFWSIIADETRDVSKTEQLSICVRYWDTTELKSCLREDCLALAPLAAMSAEHITRVMCEKVESLGCPGSTLWGRPMTGQAQ
jgi:hypothetical protein